MNKIIEELARQYAEYMCPAEYYCDGVSDENRDSDIAICIDDAKSILGWIFDKPIESRLTAEEKACVREEYDEARIFSENVAPCGIEYAKNEAEMSLLERIFGKDFFKEDKL